MDMICLYPGTQHTFQKVVTWLNLPEIESKCVILDSRDNIKVEECQSIVWVGTKSSVKWMDFTHLLFWFHLLNQLRCRYSPLSFLAIPVLLMKFFRMLLLVLVFPIWINIYAFKKKKKPASSHYIPWLLCFVYFCLSNSDFFRYSSFLF